MKICEKWREQFYEDASASWLHFDPKGKVALSLHAKMLFSTDMAKKSKDGLRDIARARPDLCTFIVHA